MNIKTKDNDNQAEDFLETYPLKEGEKNEEAGKKRSFKQTCFYAVKNITVEPTMLLFVAPCILTVITSQNLSLEKACRVNLNFTDEICDSLRLQSIEGQSEYEREVQKLVSNALAWKTYITATVPCVIAIFVGSWSDKTGYRKIFILIPVLGQMLVCVNGVFHTYFLKQLSLEYFVFSEAILEGFSGHWCICVLTIFSYISAITSEKERTFRMGLINFSLTVAFPIGMGLSGILLKKFGFYGGYCIAGIFHLLNFSYNAFILRDPKQTAEQKKNTQKGMGHIIRCFFDVTNIKSTFGVVFKKGPNFRRARMIVMLIVTCILFGPTHGELAILYISTRYRFSWDEVKFSIFQSYNFITHTADTIFPITYFSKHLQSHDSVLGIISTVSKISASFIYCFVPNENNNSTIFSITYFSKHLQWHDSVLGILSTVTKIFASFIYCFAPNEKIFFIAPLVDILNGTALLAMRSLTSKLVAINELGKVNSIFALADNLMPLIYIPMYTKLYAATMEVLPGSPFLMGAAMTLPAVVVFIYLFYEHRKQVNKQKRNVTSTEKTSN